MHNKQGAFSMPEIGIALVVIHILVALWYKAHVGIVREISAGEKYFSRLARQSHQAAGHVEAGSWVVWHIEQDLPIAVINIGSEENPWLIIVAREIAREIARDQVL